MVLLWYRCNMDVSGLSNQVAGAGTYVLASWLFLRLLGIIYCVAFVSLATQIKGLVGRHGILPAAEFLRFRKPGGLERLYRIPTLCWCNFSDGFLVGLCWGGAGLALLLVMGVAPLPSLILLWLDY